MQGILNNIMKTALMAIIGLVSSGSGQVMAEKVIKPLASKPPMGWNSYDSYRLDIHEQACYDNLKTFVEVFKPLGYEYFVIDAGWYHEYKLRPGTLIPISGDDKIADDNLDEHGYLIPSKGFFPNGLEPIANECHKNGVKFGVHIMRGIPRKAVKLNTPIKGTAYFARDIADTTNICAWCPLNYGVNMDKLGSQEYYDGFIQQLANYGVDFIKADDIVEFPKEIDAVVKAIEKTKRPITLSLSPGDRVIGSEVATYEKADMLRVTGDVWDNQFDIEKCFTAWLTWQYKEVREGFWFDMDMIPFGELRVTVPKNTDDEKIGPEGKHRFDQFSMAQKRTFMTMRAMSASPLFMGGVLPTLDKDSMRLLTNKVMISCNQNGKIGHMIGFRDYVQTWLTEEQGKEKQSGWVAVFNRSEAQRSAQVSLQTLGLDPHRNYELEDVWSGQPFNVGKHELEGQDCLFLRYKKID
jgi:alpha-galactosidase